MFFEKKGGKIAPYEHVRMRGGRVMATKSFTINQSFTKKGAVNLLSALEKADKRTVELQPPAKVKHIGKWDKNALDSLLSKVKISE